MSQLESKAGDSVESENLNPIFEITNKSLKATDAGVGSAPILLTAVSPKATLRCDHDNLRLTDSCHGTQKNIGKNCRKRVLACTPKSSSTVVSIVGSCPLLTQNRSLVTNNSLPCTTKATRCLDVEISAAQTELAAGMYPPKLSPWEPSTLGNYTFAGNLSPTVCPSSPSGSSQSYPARSPPPPPPLQGSRKAADHLIQAAGECVIS